MARTSLEPWKFVRDIIAPVQEANSDNLGKYFRFSIHVRAIEVILYVANMLSDKSMVHCSGLIYVKCTLLPQLFGPVYFQQQGVRFFLNASSRPSVFPSRYLLNHWAEFYQTCYITSSHGKGVREQHYFSERPSVSVSVVRLPVRHAISS